MGDWDRMFGCDVSAESVIESINSSWKAEQRENSRKKTSVSRPRKPVGSEFPAFPPPDDGIPLSLADFAHPNGQDEQVPTSPSERIRRDDPKWHDPSTYFGRSDSRVMIELSSYGELQDFRRRYQHELETIMKPFGDGYLVKVIKSPFGWTPAKDFVCLYHARGYS